MTADEYIAFRARVTGVTLARLAAAGMLIWEAVQGQWAGAAIMAALFYIAGLMLPTKPPDSGK